MEKDDYGLCFPNRSRSVAELEQLEAVPPLRGDDAPPAVLATFRVGSVLAADSYVERLRSLLGGAVRTADQIDDGADHLDESLIPAWFTAATHEGAGGEPDPTTAAGVRAYVAARAEEPWRLQDWLFCFDPELRAWAWWGVRIDSDRSLVVAVDSFGEPVFPCEELRWALYVCGAESVDGPALISGLEWNTGG